MTTTLQDQEKRPEPVLDPARLGGLVGAAVTAVGGAAVIITTGVTTETLPALGVAVGAAVTAVAALAVYLVAAFAGRAGRAQVTPLSDPRDALGRRLVPEPDAAVVVVNNAGDSWPHEATGEDGPPVLDDNAGGPVSIRGLHREYFPGEDRA